MNECGALLEWWSWENWGAWRKACPTATSSTPSCIWTGLGSNLSLHDERPVTNSLNLGMACEELCQILLSLYLSIWLIVRIFWYVCGLSYWTVGMGAGCDFGCRSKCLCFVFMDSSVTAEWWHSVMVFLLCCEILVNIWGQHGWCIPCHISGDLVYNCLVMALAWLPTPALTQEVITSVARLISQSSTVVVTTLEEAGLL